MKKIIAILIAFTFYTRYDILVWQRIFENDKLWQYDQLYHKGWFWMLWGFITLGAVLLDGWRDKVFYVVSMLILAFAGVEDIFYYWFDGRAIPAELPWLQYSYALFKPVTNVNILINAVIYIAILAIFHWLLYDKAIWQKTPFPKLQATVRDSWRTFRLHKQGTGKAA